MSLFTPAFLLLRGVKMFAVKRPFNLYCKQGDDVIRAFVSKYITAVKDNVNFSFFFAVSAGHVAVDVIRYICVVSLPHLRQTSHCNVTGSQHKMVSETCSERL